MKILVLRLSAKPMKIPASFSIVLFALSLIIASCSNYSPLVKQPQQEKPSTPTTVSQVPNSLSVVGNYVNSTGTLHTEFRNDGTFIQTSGSDSVLGKYSIKGNFVYIDEFLTLNGVAIAKDRAKVLKEQFSAHPFKIDGQDLRTESDIFTRQ